MTLPERDRRLVEIIGSCVGMDGGLLRRPFRDLRKGDVFRLFEGDGTPVDEGRWYHVDEDPYEDCFGISVVRVTPAPTSLAGPDY